MSRLVEMNDQALDTVVGGRNRGTDRSKTNNSNIEIEKFSIKAYGRNGSLNRADVGNFDLTVAQVIS